jgi:hypothetical protein
VCCTFIPSLGWSCLLAAAHTRQTEPIRSEAINKPWTCVNLGIPAWQDGKRLRWALLAKGICQGKASCQCLAWLSPSLVFMRPSDALSRQSYANVSQPVSIRILSYQTVYPFVGFRELPQFSSPPFVTCDLPRIDQPTTGARPSSSRPASRTYYSSSSFREAVRRPIHD